MYNSELHNARFQILCSLPLLQLLHRNHRIITMLFHIIESPFKTIFSISNILKLNSFNPYIHELVHISFLLAELVYIYSGLVSHKILLAQLLLKAWMV